MAAAAARFNHDSHFLMCAGPSSTGRLSGRRSPSLKVRLRERFESSIVRRHCRLIILTWARSRLLAVRLRPGLSWRRHCHCHCRCMSPGRRAAAARLAPGVTKSRVANGAIVGHWRRRWSAAIIFRSAGAAGARYLLAGRPSSEASWLPAGLARRLAMASRGLARRRAPLTHASADRPAGGRKYELESN